MDIEFHGAARTVTGSQHLITLNGAQFLLDCGLFQGRRKETYYRNQHFLYDPQDLAAVILSHAHTDHAGNLPNLIKRGYNGVIRATHATEDMCQFMLRDSGRIQESDVRFVNKRRAKRGEPAIEPLYTLQDAEQALSHFECTDYNQAFEVFPGVVAKFRDAGHILGSAITLLELEENGQTRKVVFSGDLGRKGKPILRDPIKLEIEGEIDALILESTYGNRTHRDPDVAVQKLGQAVRHISETRGKLIIPSFAVGRTQDLIYWLHRMMDDGDIPRMRIFIDSPLAVNISNVFRDHHDIFDTETLAFMGADDHVGALRFPEITYVGSVEESKSINDMAGPLIVISASGMCEAGRILHHLRNNIGDDRNMILIVSWQAPHTLGRRLVEKQPLVRIFGDEFKLRAKVETINGLSAHADRDELVEWARPLAKQTKNVFLVHGEPEPQAELSARLREAGFANVYAPELHEAIAV